MTLGRNVQFDVLLELFRLSCKFDTYVLSLGLLRLKLEHGGLELENLVLYLAILERLLLLARCSIDGRVEDASLSVIADTVDVIPEFDVFLGDSLEVFGVDGAILGQLGKSFCLRVAGNAVRDRETENGVSDLILLSNGMGTYSL